MTARFTRGLLPSRESRTPTDGKPDVDAARARAIARARPDPAAGIIHLPAAALRQSRRRTAGGRGEGERAILILEELPARAEIEPAQVVR